MILYYLCVVILIILFDEFSMVSFPIKHDTYDPENEKEDVYKVPLTINTDPFHLITISVSVNGTDIEIIVDINSNTNWLRRRIDIPSHSTLYTKRCSSIGVTDSVLMTFFHSYIDYHLSMNFINSKDTCYYYSTLGFAMHSNDSSFSLMEDFKEHYIIRQIGFFFNKKTNEKYMLLGNQYNVIYNKEIKPIRCNLNELFLNWNCRLNGIIIGESVFELKKYKKENLFQVESYISFESIQRFIIVSMDCMHYLHKTLFKEKECLSEKIGELNVLLCKRGQNYNDLFLIHFILQNTLVSLNASLLFDKEYKYNKNEFDLFLIGSLISNKNIWLIGSIILNQFDLILDYQNRNIYLFPLDYSNKNIKLDSLEVLHSTHFVEMMLLLTKINIILLFIGIVILLYSKYLNKTIFN